MARAVGDSEQETHTGSMDEDEEALHPLPLASGVS